MRALTTGHVIILAMFAGGCGDSDGGGAGGGGDEPGDSTAPTTTDTTDSAACPDEDGDGACDSTDLCVGDNPDDTDGDGVCDSDDPCPDYNPDDTDGDGVCDSDDPCPDDDPDDTDGDGVCDSEDECPDDNPDDANGDGVCDSEEWPAPNVFVLFIDDLGWTGLATDAASLGNGSDYHITPRMDELSADGVTFTAAYAGNNSPPGRAGFFSGLYQTRTKVYTSGDQNKAAEQLRRLDGAPECNRALHGSFITVNEILDDAGYFNIHIGKWDIGNDGGGDGPRDQGFDENLGGSQVSYLSNGGHFARPDGSFKLPPLPPNGIGGQFLADRLTDEAIAAIDAHPKEPWFVNLAHLSVHFPIQAPEEDLKVMQGVPVGTRHDYLEYAAMVHNLDRNVGRVIDHLETTPDPRNPGHMLIENTMVILYSDNGGQGSYEQEGANTTYDVTDNTPLRGGKGALYEGGVRVPLIIRWDRGQQAGRVVDDAVMHVDFMPTIIEAAAASGATLPDPKEQAVDGVSLMPVLEDPKGTLGRDAVYNHFPAYLDYPDDRKAGFRGEPTSVIWSGNYKLTYWYETCRWTLHDLSTDIGEANDIAVGNEALVASMGTQLVDWMVETEADMPVFKGTDTDVPLPDPNVIVADPCNDN